jgi:hypothetical protein
MKIYMSLIRSLTERAHILALSLLIAAIGLGAINTGASVSAPQYHSEGAHKSFSLSTSPANGPNAQEDNSYAPPSGNGTEGSYEGQDGPSEAQQSTNNNVAAPISNPAIGERCATCSTTSDCPSPNDCQTLVAPPAPSACGCGPYQDHGGRVMCPMLRCVDPDPR